MPFNLPATGLREFAAIRTLRALLPINAFHRAPSMLGLVILFPLLFWVTAPSAKEAGAKNVGIRIDILKEATVDIGNYFDDAPLAYHLYLENPTKTPIKDLQLTTSCGCTTLMPSGSTIPPRKKLRVDVASDLTGKRGVIVKNIVANFDHGGTKTEKRLSLTFKVQKNIAAHSGHNLQDVLFDRKCGACHAKPAAGKMGRELFVAVCAFCHGENAQGAMATGFTRVKYYDRFDPERIRAIIADGTDGKEMPGFSQAHGGPLDSTQIDSLIDYFKELKIRITR